MGLSLCSFASGSGGNCIYVCSDTTKILVDIGIPPQKVEESLLCLTSSTSVSLAAGGSFPQNNTTSPKQNMQNMSILVTHAHNDHIKYVPAFSKKHSLPVYAHRKTISSLRSSSISKLVPFSGEDFFVGDITVSPFAVSHDVHCVGFSFYHQGKKLTVTTDLGKIDEQLVDHIKDSDAVFIEANHDLELISSNPNYSWWLKRRILSDKGHLSNSACANAVLKMASCRAKNIILGHLSEENNYPELAFNAVCSTLSAGGIIEGRDVNIEVAPANSIGKTIRVI